MADTTILFASDVHGSEVCWRKFLNSARHFGAQVLLMGGDITGKAVIPVVACSHGRYRAHWEGEQVVAESDLPALERRLANAGCYTYRCDEAELARLDADPAAQRRLFDRLIRERVEAWMRLAEERLGDSGVTCLVMPGNDDEVFVAEAIATSSYVINPEGRVVDVGGLPMISVGVSNKTPWNSPREVSEEEMAALIAHLVHQVRDVRRCLFNVHVPPFGTAIDQAPVLDATLKPVVAGGSVQMGPVGSTAVRAAIERHQPLIGLHGHVHEARGAVKIGKTVCVNPGSQYGDGILDAFLVRVNAQKGLRGYQYVSG